MLVIAHKTVFTRKVTERTQLPGGCLQKMWLLKRCSSVTHDVHMGAQVCAQGCGNTYVRGQKLDHYACALLNVPFSRFPPDYSFRRWHSGMSPLYHPGGQSTGVRIWARLEAASRGRRACHCGILSSSSPPTPSKANLVFACFCNCPSSPVFLGVLFFFSFVTKVTNELVDSGGKGWRRACLGSAPPSAFCRYHGLPLLAFWSTMQVTVSTLWIRMPPTSEYLLSLWDVKEECDSNTPVTFYWTIISKPNWSE